MHRFFGEMVESVKNVANRDYEVVLKTTELSGFLHSLFLSGAAEKLAFR